MPNWSFYVKRYKRMYGDEPKKAPLVRLSISLKVAAFFSKIANYSHPVFNVPADRVPLGIL